jgi:hypothetical protein
MFFGSCSPWLVLQIVRVRTFFSASTQLKSQNANRDMNASAMPLRRAPLASQPLAAPI